MLKLPIALNCKHKKLFLPKEKQRVVFAYLLISEVFTAETVTNKYECAIE